MKKDKREYGLTEKDREWLMLQKFPSFSDEEIKMVLSKVKAPSDKILGAILFLSNSDSLDSLQTCVELANSQVSSLLNAATVKDERT